MDYLTLLKLLSLYLFYPIFLFLKYVGLLLVAVAAPFLHLAHYLLHGCMWPLRFLAKFEVWKLSAMTSILRLIIRADPVHLRRRCSASWSRHRRYVTLCFRLPHSTDESREPA